MCPIRNAKKSPSGGNERTLDSKLEATWRNNTGKGIYKPVLVYFSFVTPFTFQVWSKRQIIKWEW